MALVGLHYSKFFKEKLLTGKISGSILAGKWKIPIGDKMGIYVGKDADNVERSLINEKIGVATIRFCVVKLVKDVTDQEARSENFKNKEEFIRAIKYWHKLSKDNFVTYIRFEFKKT